MCVCVCMSRLESWEDYDWIDYGILSFPRQDTGSNTDRITEQL